MKKFHICIVFTKSSVQSNIFEITAKRTKKLQSCLTGAVTQLYSLKFWKSKKKLTIGSVSKMFPSYHDCIGTITLGNIS